VPGSSRQARSTLEPVWDNIRAARERIDYASKTVRSTGPIGPSAEHRFDIVQHLGLLYHLRDPLLSLSQIRSVINPGGLLFIETAVVANETPRTCSSTGSGPTSGSSRAPRPNWAPTVPCLLEVLRASPFRPRQDTLTTTEPYPEGEHSLQQAALFCEAVGEDAPPPKYSRELMRVYRNPGLEALAS
jgi:tRNA (mo5U34)-methyltransferase